MLSKKLDTVTGLFLPNNLISKSPLEVLKKNYLITLDTVKFKFFTVIIGINVVFKTTSWGQKQNLNERYCS